MVVVDIDLGTKMHRPRACVSPELDAVRDKVPRSKIPPFRTSTPTGNVDSFVHFIAVIENCPLEHRYPSCHCVFVSGHDLFRATGRKTINPCHPFAIRQPPNGCIAKVISSLRHNSGWATPSISEYSLNAVIIMRKFGGLGGRVARKIAKIDEIAIRVETIAEVQPAPLIVI